MFTFLRSLRRKGLERQIKALRPDLASLSGDELIIRYVEDQISPVRWLVSGPNPVSPLLKRSLDYLGSDPTFMINLFHQRDRLAYTVKHLKSKEKMVRSESIPVPIGADGSLNDHAVIHLN